MSNSSKNIKQIRTGKSLYEELLERNRRKWSRLSSGTSSKSQAKSKETIYTPRSIYPTVFKSVGHRKSYHSLKTGLSYILNKSFDLAVENEMGEKIMADDMLREIRRFDLLRDEENIKPDVNIADLPKGITDKHLKNRQMWHCILSLPNNKNDPQELQDGMRSVLGDLFVGHKYVFTVHTDTKHHHCHILLKSRSDVTGNIIRTDKRLLSDIHGKMNDMCYQRGLNLEREGPEAVKLPAQYKKLARKWCKGFQEEKFGEITADSSSIEQLKKLGIEGESLASFLHLYKENPKLAVSTVKDRPILLQLNKGMIMPQNLSIKIMENGEVTYPRLLSVYKKKTPKWSKMYLKNSFSELSANASTVSKLKDLGMDDKNITAFLNMYKEDKKMAIWTINKKPEVFAVKSVPEGFTLRKVQLKENNKTIVRGNDRSEQTPFKF